MEVANTVAYFETATIPALKSIIVLELAFFLHQRPYF
jgi:hypothetical protein